MKRTSGNRIAGVLVLGGLLALLAGCGGGGSSGGTGGGTTPVLMGGSIQGTPLSLDNTSMVSTLAGGGPSDNGAVNGVGTSARFYNPIGVTTDGKGNLYVADFNNNTIRKVVIATKQVTTIAGTEYNNTLGCQSFDATGVDARFCGPQGITTDGTNLYVADSLNLTIRKVVIATGVVTTVAGQAGTSGDTDNPQGTQATFASPQGITTDGKSLYVADAFNNKIRKVTIGFTWDVATVAGTGTAGSGDGAGANAEFSIPTSISTDGANLYVADSNNNTIRKVVIGTNWNVTTFAGIFYDASVSCQYNDGIGTAARFCGPQGITTDGTYLYVSDAFNQTIRKVAIANRAVSTIAGAGVANGAFGFADGAGTNAKFFDPGQSTTDGTNLYVADSGNNAIRMIE